MTNIEIYTNTKMFRNEFEHVDGGLVYLTIEKGYAYYDPQGRLRAFTGIWDDGEICVYKLAPSNNFNVPALIAGFLACFGVVKVAGELRKKHPNGQLLAVEMGTYFITSKLLAPHITSIADNLFGTHELCYYNVAKGVPVLKARFGGKTQWL